MARKYGTGSLYRRSDNGRWVGRLPDGRGGYRYFTGTDREDVRKRMDEARRARDRKTSSTPRGGERVRDLVVRYQRDVDPVRNRWKTVKNNAQVARDHIVPTLGSIRVTQLEPGDVQAMVNGMVARGLSVRTAGNAVATLSAMLRHAMREGVLERNVASLVVMPQATTERLPSLTTEQLRAFLAATKGESLWPVWAVLGTTGMRIGELLGLRWRDLGPGDATVTISGQFRTIVTADAIVFERQEPKTPKSRRTLHLPDLAREAIRVQRAQGRSIDVVFSRESGHGPMDRAWLSRRFHAALTAHGLPSVRLHSLRHSAIVAYLDATNGDIRAAQAIAGHQSVTTTLDTYGTEADAARKRGAEAFDRMMGREAK
jgi:integrase